MTNSDSGTKLNPGDRVRVRHDPKRDDSLQARHADRRAAFNGKIVRVETIERDGDVLVSEGTDDGAWFNPAELSPIVTDPDGCEVGGPAAPIGPDDRVMRAEIPRDAADALAVIIEALGELPRARQEAQGWHSAALLARGEAEEARQEAKRLAGDLAYIRAERDVLRGKLGAAEADSATLHTALVAERKESAGWRSRALAAEAKIPRETEEVARLEAALRTRDVQLNESRTQRKAAETALAAERSIHETAAIGADKLARQIAAVRAAWGSYQAHAWESAEAKHRAEEAIDAALGGVAVEATLEQRVAEIEARLGRLESGK